MLLSNIRKKVIKVLEHLMQRKNLNDVEKYNFENYLKEPSRTDLFTIAFNNVELIEYQFFLSRKT